jgi:hypothetical protein
VQGTTWDKIVTDDRIWLGSLLRNRTYRQFVTDDVEEIIEEVGENTATFGHILFVQYLVADRFASKYKNPRIRTIANGLTLYQDPKTFLGLHNISEKEYCLQLFGLTDTQFEEMQEGSLTIGELFRQNPAALLAPILPKNKRRIN